MIGRELAEIDGDGDSHVLKPSELTKGRKRKNIPAPTREENNDSVDGDDEFTQLQPKPGAHMVLPFIPPKVDSFYVFRMKNTFIAQLTRGLFFLFQFPTMKKEGDSLIKPSEYLKSLTSRGTSLPRFNFFLFAIYRSWKNTAFRVISFKFTTSLSSVAHDCKFFSHRQIKSLAEIFTFCLEFPFLKKKENKFGKIGHLFIQIY